MLENDSEWIKLVERFARDEKIKWFRQYAIAKKQNYASVLDDATIDNDTNAERLKNGLPRQDTCPPFWTMAREAAQLKLQEYLFPSTPSVCRYLIHRAMGAEIREVNVLPRRGALIESALIAKDSPEPLPVDKNGRRLVWRERTNLILQRQHIEVKYFLESLYAEVAEEMKRQSKWLQEQFDMSLTVEGEPGRPVDDDARAEVQEWDLSGQTIEGYEKLIALDGKRRIDNANYCREDGCSAELTPRYIKRAVNRRIEDYGLERVMNFSFCDMVKVSH